MKSIQLPIIALVLLTGLASAKNLNTEHIAPNAMDLKNHFGETTGTNLYGTPHSYADYVENNKEVFVPQFFTKAKDVVNSLEFKPYPGYQNKLNPHHVKSGDFTNVAPNAEKVIDPEITGPKIHLQTEVNYPAHVKVPTFYGFKKELQPVVAYDKVEGRIVEDKVLINKPVYGYEDKVDWIY